VTQHNSVALMCVLRLLSKVFCLVNYITFLVMICHLFSSSNKCKSTYNYQASSRTLSFCNN